MFHVKSKHFGGNQEGKIRSILCMHVFPSSMLFSPYMYACPEKKRGSITPPSTVVVVLVVVQLRGFACFYNVLASFVSLLFCYVKVPEKPWQDNASKTKIRAHIDGLGDIHDHLAVSHTVCCTAAREEIP